MIRYLIIAGAMAGNLLWAQGAGKPVYRVEYEISMKGEAQPAHRFALLIEDAGRGAIRSGEKVPITSETVNDKGSGRRTDYVDMGINLDCRLRVVEGKAQLSSSVELNEFRKPESGLPGTLQTPTIRSIRVNVDSGLRLGEKSAIVRIDDTESKGLGVMATVTAVN